MSWRWWWCWWWWWPHEMLSLVRPAWYGRTVDWYKHPHMCINMFGLFRFGFSLLASHTSLISFRVVSSVYNSISQQKGRVHVQRSTVAVSRASTVRHRHRRARAPDAAVVAVVVVVAAAWGLCSSSRRVLVCEHTHFFLCKYAFDMSVRIYVCWVCTCTYTYTPARRSRARACQRRIVIARAQHQQSTRA